MPADWCRDTAKVTGRVNETETGGPRSQSHETEHGPEDTRTHTRTQKNTSTHKALTWMTELSLLMILPSPMKAAEAEEKQMTCCPLCCEPKLLYQTLPGSQLKENLRQNYKREFLFLCAECINYIVT